MLVCVGLCWLVWLVGWFGWSGGCCLLSVAHVYFNAKESQLLRSQDKIQVRSHFRAQTPIWWAQANQGSISTKINQSWQPLISLHLCLILLIEK